MQGCWKITCIDNPLSRNGSPALCISSFGTLPYYLDPEESQPKTDGTSEIYTLFYPYRVYMQNQGCHDKMCALRFD